MSKTALITGASSGIGAAFARALAREGHTLILVARRVERLEALAMELTQAHPVRVEVIPSDLTRPEAPEALRQAVAERGLNVDMLVNNAGIGNNGAFAESTWDVNATMIELNVRALTALTHVFLPGMVDRRQGAVINVASTAAFQSLPYMAVYAATKAYVLSFSEALAEEVAGQGVKVVCLCPGPTESEFVEKAEFKTDFADKAPMMSAEQVVDEALAAVKAGRPVAIPGVMNNLTAIAPRFMPRWAITRISGAIFKPSR